MIKIIYRKTLPLVVFLTVFTMLIPKIHAETIYIVSPYDKIVRYHSILSFPTGSPTFVQVPKPYCPANMTPRIFVTPALVYGGRPTSSYPIVAFSAYAVDPAPGNISIPWRVWGVVKNSLGEVVNMSRVEVIVRCCAIGTNCE